MRAALLIGLKDLRQRLRDRSAYLVGIVVPLALVFVLNATLGGVGEEIGFEFAVVDQDGGPVASSFLEILAGMEGDGLAEIHRVDRSRVDLMVDDNEVGAGFVIPAGFSDAVASGGSARIEVIGNPEAEIGTQVATAIAEGFRAEVNAVQRSVAAALVAGGEAATPDRVAELSQEAAAFPSPLQLAAFDTEGTGFDFTTYYSIGMAVFFLYFTVQFGVLSLIGEQHTGTMARLVAAPIPPSSIILGKAMGAFVLGTASMAAMVLGTSLVLGAEWGDPAGVIALVLVGVLAAMGIVTLVATLARTPEQAGGYASIVAVVLGLLGGSFFRIDIGSGFIERLSFIAPHRWLIDGFRDLSAGGSLGDVLLPVGAVLVFAVVTGALGLMRSRRLVRSA